MPGKEEEKRAGGRAVGPSVRRLLYFQTDIAMMGIFQRNPNFQSARDDRQLSCIRLKFPGVSSGLLMEIFLLHQILRKEVDQSFMLTTNPPFPLRP